MVEEPRERLSREQRRFLAMLGVPAFGISLAYTVMTTYLPVFIERLSGPAVNGILLGTEGIFALFVPIIIGAWSDSLNTRIGGRMPFILAGTVLAVIALISMPFARGSLVWIGLALVLFFFAYFVYYSPYYALFPDLVPKEMHGRSMGFQGAFRSVGLLLALVGGGLFLSLWQPLPFLVAAATLAVVTLFFFVRGRDRLSRNNESGPGVLRGNFVKNWGLIRENRNIRLWVVANAMWEAAIAALKVFVVLYFTIGLGLSLDQVSGALALVAVAAVAAAPLSGLLADRYGHRPVMLVALGFFGLGLLLPLFTTNPYFLIGILPVAFSAVVLMTLPYSVLMGLLPEDRHGVAAGLFGFSRGMGIVAGPLLAGAAVELLQPVGAGLFVFGETQGYAAMFAVASALILLSIPLLRTMKIK